MLTAVITIAAMSGDAGCARVLVMAVLMLAWWEAFP
jgi:hypothetical protein